jgi:SPP1 gp7 family putative phage head morphogenesis protein
LAADPHIRALHDLYHPQGCACGYKLPTAATGCSLSFLALKGDNELITELYDNGTGGVNDHLLQRYAGGFDKAVTSVFGAGRQYPELENELRINAGRFGTYKTYDLSRQLDAARQSGMSKDEFEKFAKSRIGVYNAHQRTEYNTMVARSRTAKQWERFGEEKFLYPNIEWLATSSASPRPEHMAFVGLILPQDDPFWQRNQPGNEYNCKCDWRTTDKPAATGTVPDDIPPAKGLDGNPAETGELVTGQHPYFTRNAAAPGWIEDKALLQLPAAAGFVEKTTGSGKTYQEHRLVDKANETVKNRKIVALLLNNGYKDIKLLPIINKNEKLLRERYYGKNFMSSTLCPDASIKGTIVEFKESNRANISRNIGMAALKSNIVVIKIKSGSMVSDTHIENIVNRQWNMENRKNLTEIIAINDGRLLSFKKKTE